MGSDDVKAEQTAQVSELKRPVRVRTSSHDVTGVVETDSKLRGGWHELPVGTRFALLLACETLDLFVVELEVPETTQGKRKVPAFTSRTSLRLLAWQNLQEGVEPLPEPEVLADKIDGEVKAEQELKAKAAEVAETRKNGKVPAMPPEETPVSKEEAEASLPDAEDEVVVLQQAEQHGLAETVTVEEPAVVVPVGLEPPSTTQQAVAEADADKALDKALAKVTKRTKK